MLTEIEQVHYDKEALMLIFKLHNPIDETADQIDECVNRLKKDDTMLLEIRPKPKPRSPQANKLMWEILYRMAQKLHTTKQELYKQMLKEYGWSYTKFLTQEEFKSLNPKIYKIVEETGKTYGSVKEYIIFPSSATYESIRFAYFLDMIILEAKQIGI